MLKVVDYGREGSGINFINTIMRKKLNMFSP